MNLLKKRGFSAFFRDNVEDTEFILRIILDRPTLIVKNVRVQYELKNLNGRSVKLDILAEDNETSRLNVEIQRDDRDSGFKRARMKFFKEDQRGIETMCKVMEDMRNDLRVDIALEMINDAELSLEKIAKYSGLSIEKVRELAEGRSA